MTKAEELSQVLRVEYLFYNQYRRWQQEGRLTPKEASRKINAECKAIRRAKDTCRQELEENEYPEEYYYDDPEEFIPEPSEKLMIVNKIEIPEGDGTQMNILDYMQDGNICWR